MRAQPPTWLARRLVAGAVRPRGAAGTEVPRQVGPATKSSARTSFSAAIIRAIAWTSFAASTTILSWSLGREPARLPSTGASFKTSTSVSPAARARSATS